MSGRVGIYCVCFPEHEPRKHQKNQVDIMCNAHGISDEYRARLKRKGFVFDDTGDNISNLNWAFGDLTATYWIWKNSDYDVTGTSQYRRFWTSTVPKMQFQPNTLYVQEPVRLGESVKDQYIRCHGIQGIEILYNLSASGEIPLTSNVLDKAFALDYIYSCNMFIAHKELYDRVCEVLFDIVFKVYKELGDSLLDIETRMRRVPAFLAERIIMALIEEKELISPGMNVVPLKWSVKKEITLERFAKNVKRLFK